MEDNHNGSNSIGKQAEDNDIIKSVSVKEKFYQKKSVRIIIVFAIIMVILSVVSVLIIDHMRDRNRLNEDNDMMLNATSSEPEIQASATVTTTLEPTPTPTPTPKPTTTETTTEASTETTTVEATTTEPTTTAEPTTVATTAATTMAEPTTKPAETTIAATTAKPTSSNKSYLDIIKGDPIRVSGNAYTYNFWDMPTRAECEAYGVSYWGDRVLKEGYVHPAGQPDVILYHTIEYVDGRHYNTDTGEMLADVGGYFGLIESITIYK